MVKQTVWVTFWNHVMYILPASTAQWIWQPPLPLNPVAPDLFEYVWQIIVCFAIFDTYYYVIHFCFHRVSYIIQYSETQNWSNALSYKSTHFSVRLHDLHAIFIHTIWRLWTIDISQIIAYYAVLLYLKSRVECTPDKKISNPVVCESTLIALIDGSLLFHHIFDVRW